MWCMHVCDVMWCIVMQCNGHVELHNTVKQSSSRAINQPIDRWPSLSLVLDCVFLWQASVEVSTDANLTCSGSGGATWSWHGEADQAQGAGRGLHDLISLGKFSDRSCTSFQRRRNDNINKICVLEGVGEGEFYGKLSQNAVFFFFLGKFHDNEILEILRILLSEILLSFGRLLSFFLVNTLPTPPCLDPSLQSSFGISPYPVVLADVSIFCLFFMFGGSGGGGGIQAGGCGGRFLPFEQKFLSRLKEILEAITILTETITSENKQKSQDLGFSLCWITKAKAKENLWDFILIRKVACCYGSCVPNMTFTKANAKENLGEFICLSIYESESEIKSPDFHL